MIVASSLRETAIKIWAQQKDDIIYSRLKVKRVKPFVRVFSRIVRTKCASQECRIFIGAYAPLSLVFS